MLVKVFIFMCSIQALLGCFQQASKARSAVNPSTGADECQFSKDCKKICGNVQDAACICKFGKCIVDGSGFAFGFGGGRNQQPQCKTYNDCPCRNTPEKCFCKSGVCKEERWECHKPSDCSKLAKCKNKPCGCTDSNLCESDCVTAQDCVNNKAHCSTIVGYQCKCESNLCDLERLPAECDSIKDCVNKGKCTSSKPCSCTNNQCVEPWFAKKVRNNPKKNCRVPESTFGDCGFHILDCAANGCNCKNPINISKYEKWGECTVKN